MLRTATTHVPADSGTFHTGKKVFIKPPDARCTTQWPVGTISAPTDGVGIEVDAIRRHIADLRVVPSVSEPAPADDGANSERRDMQVTRNVAEHNPIDDSAVSQLVDGDPDDGQLRHFRPRDTLRPPLRFADYVLHREVFLAQNRNRFWKSGERVVFALVVETDSQLGERSETSCCGHGLLADRHGRLRRMRRHDVEARDSLAGSAGFGGCDWVSGAFEMWGGASAGCFGGGWGLEDKRGGRRRPYLRRGAAAETGGALDVSATPLALFRTTTLN